MTEPEQGFTHAAPARKLGSPIPVASKPAAQRSFYPRRSTTSAPGPESPQCGTSRM